MFAQIVRLGIEIIGFLLLRRVNELNKNATYVQKSTGTFPGYFLVTVHYAVSLFLDFTKESACNAAYLLEKCSKDISVVQNVQMHIKTNTLDTKDTLLIISP